MRKPEEPEKPDIPDRPGPDPDIPDILGAVAKNNKPLRTHYYYD